MYFGRVLFIARVYYLIERGYILGYSSCTEANSRITLTATMVTVINDDNNKDHTAPPPTYAQVVAGAGPAEAPPAQHVHFQPGASSHPHTTAPLLQHPHSPPLHAYGPTPIGGPTPILLPYYDPGSQWALEEGARRASRRFWGALFWGLVIWVGMSALLGSVVDDAVRRRRYGAQW